MASGAFEARKLNEIAARPLRRKRCFLTATENFPEYN